MSRRGQYVPGHARGASIEKDGERWTLVLVRELAHPPAKVWTALTDPAHLREWAPFDADANLGTTGAVVKLTTVGAPTPHVTETRVRRADPPALLEFDWGGQSLRWQLEPLPNDRTRLTLWHNIVRNYIALGAAGWHICLDVLESDLDGHPIGRTVGPDAMQVDGWQRLLGDYAATLGVSAPSWSQQPGA